MGVYLSTPETSKHVITGESQRMKYAAVGMQGWRTTMEDAHVVDLEVTGGIIVAGVFDGHGGKDVANYASRVFVRELTHRPEFASANYPEALSSSFLQIDDLLRTPAVYSDLARTSSDSSDGNYIINNSGCTAVVALMTEREIYVANAGDSRCILGRAGGPVQMSFDHKPTLPTESQRISKAGGYVVEGRVMGNLNLSRSLGDLTYKDNRDLPPQEQMITAYPDVRKEDLTDDTDFVLLACDGIWDVLSCEQCANFVYTGLSEGKTPSQIVESMLDACLARDVSTSMGLGCDNMTCVLLVFKR